MENHEKTRPFLYLRDNIDRLQFVCPPSCAQEYKAVFANVLTRLDAFFHANELYDVVDYQAMVDKLLNERQFRFGLSYGRQDFPQFNFGKQTIQMPVGRFGKGANTESELCHEFIHFLTTQAELQYRERGVEHRRQMSLTPDSNLRLNEATQAQNDLPVTAAVDFPMLPGFLKEGFTEAMKMYIYPPAECNYHYQPQVEMVRYLNRITDGGKNWLDFLRGNWAQLGQYLGAEQYCAWQTACEEFQQQYHTTAENQFNGEQSMSFTSDPRYRQIQDIITRQVLHHVGSHPEQYSEDDFRRIANGVIWHAPASADGNIQPEQYQPELLAAARALATAKTTDHAASKQYYQNLQDFLTQTGKGARESMRTSHTVDEIVLPSTAMSAPEPERER